MAYTAGGRVLWIERENQLHHLGTIPAQVEELGIDARMGDRPVHLPRLPATVKKLSLFDIVLQGHVHLSDGLEELNLDHVTSDTPMTRWVFPSTLERVTVDTYPRQGEAYDLRSVTAPTITLNGLAEYGRGGVDQAYLPEGLDKLTIGIDSGMPLFFRRVAFPRLIAGVTDSEAYRSETMDAYDEAYAADSRETLNNVRSKILLLPPYLRSLELDQIDEVYAGEPSQTVGIRDLVIDHPEGVYDLETLFPELETLTVRNNRDRDNTFNFRLPNLKSLTLDRYSSGRRITLSTPNLESLTLVSMPEETMYGDFGGLVKSLELINVRGFPESEDWERLETVSIARSDIELPFIPYLSELTIDRPLMANGYEVRDLSEYKQAWGQSRRKKGAQRL